jgi:hypothetical protein
MPEVVARFPGVCSGVFCHALLYRIAETDSFPSGWADRGGNKFIGPMVLGSDRAIVDRVLFVEIFSRNFPRIGNQKLMNNENDRNYVSVGSWMWMMFVTAIPVIGFIMILVWAFAGDNDSRKNYYRAILAWLLVIILLLVFFALLGNWPAILKQIQSWTHKA